jgi:phage baseplate assembly protein W
MATYKGFSSINKTKNFRITDFELVKTDIQNHFNIRKGEKLMNPEFGTIIWDMIFEPLTEDNKTLIVQDVQNIIANDPRVAATDIVVTTYDRGIQIELSLLYISTDQTAVLTLDFNNTTNSLNVN